MSGRPAEARIRRITAEDAFPLRFGVLRRALPPAESRYPRDDDPRTVHLGAFIDGRLVAVGSFLPEPPEDSRVEDAYRLRGMVTMPDYRGRGIGGVLLDRGVAEVARTGARMVWCNGRTGALSFYRRHGFAPVGEVFETPATGPHYRFVRPLPPDRADQSPYSASSASP